MGNGEAIGIQRMGKTGRIKVQPQILIPRPGDPTGKMHRLDSVTLYQLLRLQIDGVQIEPLRSRK